MKRINKNVLKQAIVENRNFIRKIPGKFIERECFRLPENVKKVIILHGVRRSGKTYLRYHLMKENPDNSLYIDFEDERLEGFSPGDFETLREAFYELSPGLIQKKVYFLFDEIQEVEGWEKFCRRMVEKTPVEVFTAGSSSKIYPENISTTLRGRAWSIEVFPFSFKEFAAFKGSKADDLLLASEERFRMVEYFSEYLKWGGFPEVISAKSEFEKQKIIKEYLDAIFFKDLVERYEVSNLPLLKTLKNKIFSTFSTKFSLTSFYNKTKGSFPFSRDLLYRYYQHLLDSKTVFAARKFSDSEYKKTRNPAKVYIIDSSLSQRVAHDDSARVLENTVFIELLRRNYKPHYFSNANECDFIAVREDKTDVIQVTYQLDERNRQREFNGIIEAAKRIRTNIGYILTYNEADEFVIEDINIKVVPAWKWLLDNTKVDKKDKIVYDNEK
ncbi:MAG: ATP-binding protein [Candidatus Aminicenantes bacterium]|nr:MAG: ATP-binding protein [Candidatus Aminicenantes bacterium]